MSETPKFFVPGADTAEYEAVFAELARSAGCAVPDLPQRVYSIVFEDRLEEWTATVGEQLRGVSRKQTRSRGRTTERTYPRRDPALVLAIFPGPTFTVVTDHFPPVHSVRSSWENPFFPELVKSVTCFRE